MDNVIFLKNTSFDWVLMGCTYDKYTTVFKVFREHEIAFVYCWKSMVLSDRGQESDPAAFPNSKVWETTSKG